MKLERNRQIAVRSPSRPSRNSIETGPRDTMSFEEELIEEVRQNRIIYDKTEKNYKNIDLKAKAWDNIAAKLGVTTKKAQVRWKSLRDRYQRSKRDFLPSGSANDTEISFKKYKYAENLSFLDDVLHTNPRLVSIKMRVLDFCNQCLLLQHKWKLRHRYFRQLLG